MPTLTGYNPWVGTGSLDDPYDMGIPISWQWRAKRILAGLTCYDSVTGLVGGPMTARVSTNEAFRLNSASVRLLNTGSGIVYEMEVPDVIAEVISPMTEMPVVIGSVGDFRAFCVSEVDRFTLRFSLYRPDLDWVGDTPGAAVSVISDLVSGDAEAQRIWSYYRDVLNPSLPTPDCPLELLIRSATADTRANIVRCNQIVAAPDDLDNQVRRAELAYELIVYSECVSAIPEPV